MGVTKKELEDKKEELTTQIDLLQVQIGEFFMTKTFYETEVKNKVQRQNDIFQELKRLEGEIIDFDKLSMKFHNEWNSAKWNQDKLKEERDELRQQIWSLK